MKMGLFSKMVILYFVCCFIYTAYSSFNKKDDLLAYASNEKTYQDRLLYQNKEHHDLKLSKDNIEITCHGSNFKDEQLVKENLVLDVMFKQSDNIKKDNIVLKPKEKVEIYIKDQYRGNIMPDEAVTCDYKVNVSVI